MITKITYSALFDRGNYQNERIELTRQVEPDDIIEEVFEDLKLLVHDLAGKKDLYYENQKLERDYNNILKKIDQAKTQWEQAAEFLTAQGLRHDAPKFPELKLLAPVEETRGYDDDF